MNDYFFSFSTVDKAKVDAVRVELERLGLRVWMDLEQVGLGDAIAARLDEGIQASQHSCFSFPPRGCAASGRKPFAAKARTGGIASGCTPASATGTEPATYCNACSTTISNTLPLYEQIHALAGLAQFYRITNDRETLTDVYPTLRTMEGLLRTGAYMASRPNPVKISSRCLDKLRTANRNSV